MSQVSQIQKPEIDSEIIGPGITDQLLKSVGVRLPLSRTGEPFEMTTEKKYTPKELEKNLLDWYVKNCWLKEMRKYAEQYIRIKAEYLGSEEGKHKYRIYAEADPEFWIYKNAKDEKEAENIFKFISSAKKEGMKQEDFAVRFPGTVKNAIEKKLGESFEVSYDPNPWVEHETNKTRYEFTIKKKGAVEKTPETAVEVSTPTASGSTEAVKGVLSKKRDEYLTIDGAKEEINEWMKTAIKKSGTKQFECVDENTAKETLAFVERGYLKYMKDGMLTVKLEGTTVTLTTNVAEKPTVVECYGIDAAIEETNKLIKSKREGIVKATMTNDDIERYKEKFKTSIYLGRIEIDETEATKAFNEGRAVGTIIIKIKKEKV